MRDYLIFWEFDGAFYETSLNHTQFLQKVHEMCHWNVWNIWMLSHGFECNSPCWFDHKIK